MQRAKILITALAFVLLAASASAFEADTSSTARLKVYYPDAPALPVNVKIYGEDGQLMKAGVMQNFTSVAGQRFFNWTTPATAGTFSVFINATGVDGFSAMDTVRVVGSQTVSINPEDIWTYGDRTLTEDVSMDPGVFWSYTGADGRTLTQDVQVDYSELQQEHAAIQNVLNGQVAAGVLDGHFTVQGKTIAIKRGDYKKLTINLGPAWNLTGKKVYFSAKKKQTDAEYIFDVECSVTDAVNGICEAELFPTDTAIILTGYYEVEVRELDGTKPMTAKDGDLRIVQDLRQ